MSDQWKELSPEVMAHVVGAMRTEEQPIDPWNEIIELSRVDAACHRAVYMVRSGRIPKHEAVMWLALYQTKRAIEVEKIAVDALKLQPMKFIVKREEVAGMFDAQPQSAG